MGGSTLGEWYNPREALLYPKPWPEHEVPHTLAPKEDGLGRDRSAV